MSAPDVDDEFAVDVEGDGGAQFPALGDLVGQCLGYFVESVIAVAVYDVVHPAIMRRAERLRGRFESRSRAEFGIPDGGREPVVPFCSLTF